MDSQVFMMTLFLLVQHSTGLAAHDDGWSMKVPAEVRAIEGYPIVLPCSFSHPHGTQHTSMHVVWRLGHGHSGTELFRCTSLDGSQHCQSGPHQDQRYRLEGDHRAHDLSLRINSATLDDNGRYYCRVELPGQLQGSYENKLGTRLRVEAPPRILSLSIGGGVVTGLKALCQVQGSPLPDIQWIGSNDILDADTRPLSQESPGQHHTTSQLLDIQPGGQYTCTASNPLGKDQATVYILLPSPQRSMKKHSLTALPMILGLVLGLKVLMALGLGTWMIKRSIKP